MCEWPLSVVDVFVTACLFCSAIRSACAMATVCGCVAVPVMFSESAVPAEICAPAITAVWPWLSEMPPVTLLSWVVLGVVGVLSSSQPETVMTTVLNSARADSRVNSRRVIGVASASGVVTWLLLERQLGGAERAGANKMPGCVRVFLFVLGRDAAEVLRRP